MSCKCVDAERRDAEVEPDGATPETVPLVVPDPLNPRYSYGGGKITSELMSVAWQRTGILDRLIIVRPHNITGPDMGTRHVVPEFCQRMNRLCQISPEGTIPFPIQGDGTETRSFCWIGDCIDQFALLLTRAPRGAEIYHAGYMDERTIESVAREVARVYGRTIKVVPGVRPAGSPLRRLPDTGKIEALYGAPLQHVPFAEIITRTAGWYRDNG